MSCGRSASSDQPSGVLRSCRSAWRTTYIILAPSMALSLLIVSGVEIQLPRHRAGAAAERARAAASASMFGAGNVGLVKLN